MWMMHLHITSLSPFLAFLLSADFFQSQLFLKLLSGIQPECQTVKTQIRSDALSGLIWVQTVCKSYQQTAEINQNSDDEEEEE